MIEIRKAALQGAFGSATKQASLVIPVFNDRDPLKLVAPPFLQEWPYLFIVSDNAMQCLKVDDKDARFLFPHQRLNLYDVQRLGLIKFKEILLNASAIYVVDKLSYKNLFAVAVKHKGLVGHLHRDFLKSLQAPIQ
jgi:hypothetical protein